MRKYFLKWLISPLVLLLPFMGSAQKHEIKGKVSGRQTAEGHEQALPYASIYWLNAHQAVTADENGNFSIHRHGKKEKYLVASFVGYRNDTIAVEDGTAFVNFLLISNSELDEVEVSEKLDGSYISRLKPIKTEVITEEGLQKLACCNLSESFENNATVDVGYSDAVSGAKKIQMLGLSGIYSQVMTENIPAIRGLATAYGLSYVPGSWMQSIQVSKGTSSVINGYESVTGQINIEYKKPEHHTEPLFVNLYGNLDGRMEANILSTIKINDRWKTMLLTHGGYNNRINDHNKDGFVDLPVGWIASVMNRWTYEREHMHIQFGINAMQDERKGGQTAFLTDGAENTGSYYGTEINSGHYSAFLKAGFSLDHHNNRSLGMISSFSHHEQNSIFGLKKYDGRQNSLYMNLIWQSFIGNTNHRYSTGLSYMFDDYAEVFMDSVMYSNELVPGAFFQYTYSYLEKMSMILGVRADYHSVFGMFYTPRAHLKYNFTEMLTLRASAGRGYRSPRVFAENTGLMASSRMFIFKGKIREEKAWNYGLNLTREFALPSKRKASVSADFYRTDFESQLIADMDASTQQIVFYELDGRSWSNSTQIDMMIQPFKGFEFTLAGRFNDVKRTIDGRLREAPFVSKYKGLFTASWAAPYEKWKVDATLQYNGPSRLPDTYSSPEPYRRSKYSESYFIVHAQLTRKFKYLDIYLGAENITDYTQHHPIVAHEDPFGKHFDASMIWGPLMGRTIYAGLRLNIK